MNPHDCKKQIATRLNYYFILKTKLAFKFKKREKRERIIKIFNFKIKFEILFETSKALIELRFLFILD